jgi:hypothetical protein
MEKINAPKNDRQWRATTGLDQARFEKLLLLFEAGYQNEFGRSIEERMADNPGTTSNFPDYRSLLFFTLFSLKSGLTYDVLGFVFNLDVSNAKRNQSLGLQILQRSLADAGHLPERNFESPEEFWKHFEGQKVIILDGTEQRIQRPSNSENQKAFYSGKKKATR